MIYPLYCTLYTVFSLGPLLKTETLRYWSSPQKGNKTGKGSNTQAAAEGIEVV